MTDWDAKLKPLTLAQSKLLNLILLQGYVVCVADYSPAVALASAGLVAAERLNYGSVRLTPIGVREGE